jgi:hypothetical protein
MLRLNNRIKDIVCASTQFAQYRGFTTEVPHFSSRWQGIREEALIGGG